MKTATHNSDETNVPLWKKALAAPGTLILRNPSPTQQLGGMDVACYAFPGTDKLGGTVKLSGSLRQPTPTYIAEVRRSVEDEWQQFWSSSEQEAVDWLIEHLQEEKGEVAK